MQRGSDAPLPWAVHDESSLISINYSSGTTGQPKGVLLSQRSLSDACERLIDVMRIDGSIREYIGVPVYHSFGFARCRTVARACGEFFIPARGFSPVECAELLAAGRHRDVRRRLYEASIGRGSDGSALDVLDLVKDMVRLRVEKAALLGFANYAELVVDQQTAPDFAAVQTMMNRLAPAAACGFARHW